LDENSEPQQNQNVAVDKNELSAGAISNVENVAVEIPPLDGMQEKIAPNGQDADGFDWTNGAQHEPEQVARSEPVKPERVRYLDAKLQYRWADSVDDVWKQIKAEHAARRKREKRNQ
jgi:hypothetical protein